jgi:hypothetical protein
MRIASLIALSAAAVMVEAQWDQVCVSEGYSAWNQTACDSATGTCCDSGFSVSGKGCCSFPNAVCCPGGYTCCPADSQCVLVSGTGYSQIYNCTSQNAPTITARSVCKPGPHLPFSTTQKNVLIIGDSVSIGYTPYVAEALSSVALVQHAPWDVSDGGAEELAYGIYCLKYFLASPSGIAIKPDVVMFNWGLHDGPMSNDTTPGQNEPAIYYGPHLANLTNALVAWAKPLGVQLLFALTSPMLCNVQGDGCVIANNNLAAGIMAQYGIPTINLHDAIVQKCGPVPQASCFGETGCWCPHCPPGYQWLATSTIAPAIAKLLGA